MLRPSSVLIAVLLLSAGALDAQSVDTIRANPNAVTLRQFWRVDGTAGEQVVGAGYGPLGDVFHTGASAWAVMANGLRECAIYSYDTATKTVQLRQIIRDHIASTVTPLSPVPIVGNFFGNDSLLVMLDHRPSIHHFFAIGDSLIDTVPRFVLTVSIIDAKVADLDNDGADDLILLGATSQANFLWVYRGGPEFNVATPTISVQTKALGQYLFVADVNADHRLDIVGVGSNLEVYLGDSTLWSWTLDHPADNLRPFPGPLPTAIYNVGMTDCDGDSIPDISLAPSPNHIWLFRSRTGKSWATRSFDSTDVDNIYTRPNFAAPLNIGPLSDSTGRYGTMALISGGSHLIFSGGVNGPDARWDAVGGGSPWTKPALDCDGDGWGDYMTGAGISASGGYCTIYAGGPEIPRDPTVGVRWVPVTGERHTQAIAIWPNPAHDLVRIAWRGDLRRFPREFRVHDAAGALVATGSVDAGTAEALWDCSARPDGHYTLTLLDASGTVLATSPLLIHH